MIMSIGLDTSIVLRLLTGEPEEQSRKAFDFIDKCFADAVDVQVSDFVVLEAYHALIYHYEVPKSEAIQTLLSFLSSSFVKVSADSKKVLSEYKGTGAGLADRMIRIDYLKHVDKIITFDVDFAKLENVRLLRSAGLQL